MSAGAIVEWALFLALAAVALAGAAMMLLTMSMYRAGLFLMVSFLALAGLFFLLEADLLAVIQIMMNAGAMLVMMVFMVMLMMDPGGEMMWDMKRQMRLPGLGAFSMSMPRRKSPADDEASRHPPEPSDESPVPHGSDGIRANGSDLSMGATALAGAAEYTCPMHPAVRSTAPDHCPKCGMELVPVEAAALDSTPDEEAAPAAGKHAPSASGDAAATAPLLYTCPMHPEAVAEGPESCPKCGMNLVPVATGSPMSRTAPTPARTASVPSSGHEGRMPGDSGSRATAPAMSPAAHHRMMVDMAMSTEQLPWALAIGSLSAIGLVALVLLTPWTVASSGPVAEGRAAVGELLLTRYMMVFEGAAMLILAGIAGGVILGRREGTASASAASGSLAPEAHPAAGPHHHNGEITMHESHEAKAPKGAKEVWTCPMHLEVRATGPGQCPKCGMNLVPESSLGGPPDAGAGGTRSSGGR